MMRLTEELQQTLRAAADRIIPPDDIRAPGSRAWAIISRANLKATCVRCQTTIAAMEVEQTR